MTAAAADVRPLDALRGIARLDVPVTVKAVLWSLLTHADSRTWLCWPSVGRLGREAGISQRHARYALRHAEALGLVETTHRPGMVSHYVLRGAEIVRRAAGRVVLRLREATSAPAAPASSPEPRRRGDLTRLERLDRLQPADARQSAVLVAWRTMVAAGTAWPREYGDSLRKALEAYAGSCPGLHSELAAEAAHRCMARKPYWARPAELAAAAREVAAERAAVEQEEQAEVTEADLVAALQAEAARIRERNPTAADFLAGTTRRAQWASDPAGALYETSREYYRHRMAQLADEDLAVRREAAAAPIARPLAGMTARAREQTIQTQVLLGLQAEDDVLDPERLVALLL